MPRTAQQHVHPVGLAQKADALPWNECIVANEADHDDIRFATLEFIDGCAHPLAGPQEEGWFRHMVEITTEPRPDGRAEEIELIVIRAENLELAVFGFPGAKLRQDLDDGIGLNVRAKQAVDFTLREFLLLNPIDIDPNDTLLRQPGIFDQVVWRRLLKPLTCLVGSMDERA